MGGPLQGLRVLDLTRVLAGPWTTQLLADLGATVIKVERPVVGDDTRHWGPPWLRTAPTENDVDDNNKNNNNNSIRDESAYFLSANRGKYSITIDIKQKQGQEILRQLASTSDVMIENFKVGSLRSKNLDYESIRQINPNIIYCSITGFGQYGSRATEPGYDYLIQGMGGMMSVTGREDSDPGGGPLRVGIPIADLTTGMYASSAILAALYHRNNLRSNNEADASSDGHGQYIDMALLDSQVSILANQAQNYFLQDTSTTSDSEPFQGRTGNWHPNLAPYQTFPANDGKEDIIIAVGNDGQFQRLCNVLNLPELADDVRYKTNTDRVLHRKQLATIIGNITRTKSAQDWISKLTKSGIPCGKINSLEDVFCNEVQVQERGMKIELDTHASFPQTGRSLSMVANPIKYSKTPLEYNKAPPTLGEDTEYVLRNMLGKSDDEIQRLVSDKII